MRQRWVAIAVVASSAIVAATCVHEDLVDCGNGFACPAGLSCVTDELLTKPTCATPDQLDACDAGSAPTGTMCTLGGDPGTCFGGACIVEVCGDAIIEGREVCDDGNTVGSDGCSANCVSTETCGDGVIDLAQGEQCDDGVRGVSGDGCSSQCKVEYLFWRDVTPSQIAARYGVAYTTSPSGNVMLYGGAIGSGSNHNATYNETWEWDGTTWGKLDPPTPAPRRTLMAFAYDKRRDRVVVFGGFDATSQRTDETWEFDGVTWTQMHPTMRPSARASASMACGPQRCMMLGGDGMGSGSSDMWFWDGQDWSHFAGASPGARTDAALAYDETRDVFVLSNGSNGVAFADTWEFVGSGWVERDTDLLPLNGVPISSAYDPAQGVVHAFSAGQMFKYTSAGWGSDNAPPSGSAAQSLVAWNDKRQRLTVSANATLITGYELDGTNWTTANSGRPGGSTHAQVAFEPSTGRTILFDRLSGTWAWDGTMWRLLSSNKVGTPTLSLTQIVLDEQCGDIVLYGGLTTSATVSSETWSFDGTWHQLPIVGPPGRMVHAMAYDPIRHAVVMFGGRQSVVTTTVLGDMWQLAGPCNARVWSRIDTTPLPSARSQSSLAFDRERGQLVLFGGQDMSGPLGDTWTWDGTAWTPHDVTPSPPARFDHAFAFDPKRREIILVGGRADQLTRVDDVWRWNGDAWTSTPALVSPLPRAGAALAPDRTGALVLLGGDTIATMSTPEVARLSYDQALHPDERCQIGDADEDRDGLIGCDDPDCRWRCAPDCPLSEPFASCTGARCGDGTCSLLEDRLLCPADCP